MRTARATMTLGLALLALSVDPSRAGAHPLHSTITELVTDPKSGTVRATIRVFADDLRAAVLQSARGRAISADGPGWDAAAFAYASGVFALQDAHGHALPVRSCGIRRSADLVWLCVETSVSRDVAPLRVRNAMLCELYDDQVNVVQGNVGTSRRSLLFVRGDRFKELR